ncbi:pepsin-like aspartic protease [Aspergillus glaucus CBS 516.65]|uniref:Aspergillopepsin-1 n=1 Tax=Aspergillus glaucus CBS 516.65 TaxID=1160497 RepID=A0A1L9V903_ASPGL|nr:hypothetical protein ASPGLDRAFT_39055 [Aspergillus glaucus CBS 516.65]OJJ80359.1 hypothetical protein ASPGLDRAFT_39055 [Aspergillus glaucus CBS 516.65]
MLVLNAITLLAGLSTVSAVPMAQPRRRGFTLNQLIKPTTQGLARTINLPGIYAGAYTKFGKSVPADLKSAAENGTAVAKPEENDKEYLTPVKIGGTTLNLDIDTGSADLWVFSSELSTTAQSGHSIYKPASNATKMEGYSWEISYGDGSGAIGDVYKDTVTVGGVTAHGQAVEAAKKISRSFVSDKNNDGLMGLAFSSLNTVKPHAQKTFFDTVKDDLDEPVFAVALKHQAAGSYDFGYIDKSKYTGSLTYTEVDSTDGYWMFTAEGYGIGDGDANSTPLTGIADTGTTLLMLPEEVVDAYYKQVSGAKRNAMAGGYVVPCDAELPDFTTVISSTISSGSGSSTGSSTGSSPSSSSTPGFGGGFGDGGLGSLGGLLSDDFGSGIFSNKRSTSSSGSGSYKAVTPGKHIKMSAIDEEGSSCFGGIQSNSGMSFSIFGDVFLKSQYVVFDPEKPRLGFAPQA